MTNQDLARYLGLPTYPIKEAMRLGKRTMAEYQYLINHGFFSSWHRHHIITKENERYKLYSDYGPVPYLEAEAATLDELIKLHDTPIAAYQWFPNWLDDNKPVHPLPTNEYTQTSEELEAILEVEPA